MADLFNEMLNKLDSFSDEQINELLSRLEVKQSRNIKGMSPNNDVGVVPSCCHACGSVSIVKIGHRNGKQRSRTQKAKTSGITDSSKPPTK